MSVKHSISTDDCELCNSFNIDVRRKPVSTASTAAKVSAAKVLLTTCFSFLDCQASGRVFLRRLTSGGIFNNRLLFMNNRLLFSILFSGNFCGGTRP